MRSQLGNVALPNCPIFESAVFISASKSNVRKSHFGFSNTMYFSVFSACSQWLPVSGPLPVMYDDHPPAASAPGM